MDDVFSELVAIDLHDAVTGGLRRTLDALRAVLERTRGDVTDARCCNVGFRTRSSAG